MGRERDRDRRWVCCQRCGRAVATGRWHPVAAPPATPADRVYPFCSRECRRRWLAALASE